MHSLLKDNRISSIIFPLSTYRCQQRSWCISTILLSIKCKCRRLVFSLFQSCSLKQLYHIYTRLYITSNLRIPLTYCHACLAHGTFFVENTLWLFADRLWYFFPSSWCELQSSSPKHLPVSFCSTRIDLFLWFSPLYPYCSIHPGQRQTQADMREDTISLTLIGISNWRKLILFSFYNTLILCRFDRFSFSDIS
jgi:hypothetical protein